MVVTFDLDDTIYKEREFVDSAFRYIASRLAKGYCLDPNDTYRVMAQTDGNPFDALMDYFKRYEFNVDVTIPMLVEMYRFHMPDIILPDESRAALDRLIAEGVTLALITDGRSTTQRNKIQALNLYSYFDDSNIYISEEYGYDKTSPNAFWDLMHKYPNDQKFVYVGDNFTKDFLQPNLLGWRTVALLDPAHANIHPQPTNLAILPPNSLPTVTIPTLSALSTVL